MRRERGVHVSATDELDPLVLDSALRVRGVALALHADSLQLGDILEGYGKK
jgi:hypothetical protein